MINRRQVLLQSALVGGAAAVAAAPHARAAEPPRPQPRSETVTPPKGPWTAFGDVRRAGGKLHFAELGPKDSGRPPIVLLHKLSGWLSDWRLVAPDLAAGRRVIAFDLPGHGGSQWEGPPPYVQTLGETATLLVGALDEMGIETVDLIGTSLGGCVSVSLSAFFPERVRKLAIVSSALGGRRSLAEIRTGIDEKQTDMFDSDGRPLPTPAERLRETFGIINAEPINAEATASRKAAGLWIQPSERGVAITDIRGTLARVTAPTLLLYGDRDRAYLKYRDEAQAMLKTSTTKVVENSGAFVMQDNPPATAAILREWVDA
jgi:pimeloyl-ACP methyl ester carboxylesterase